MGLQHVTLAEHVLLGDHSEVVVAQVERLDRSLAEEAKALLEWCFQGMEVDGCVGRMRSAHACLVMDLSAHTHTHTHTHARALSK